MEIIKKDNQLFIQQSIPVSIQEEEQRLSSLEGCMLNDARELAEYEAKVTEIESLPIPDEYKIMLRSQIVFYSPSGVTQEMVDAQRAKVELLRSYDNV